MPLSPEQELELITSTCAIAKSAERIFDKLERLEAANYRRAERSAEILTDMSRRFDACLEQLRKDLSDIRHQLYPMAKGMERVQSEVERVQGDVERSMTPIHGVPAMPQAQLIGLITPAQGVPAYNPASASSSPVPVKPEHLTGIALSFHVNWKTVWSVGRWFLAALAGGSGVALLKALDLIK